MRKLHSFLLVSFAILSFALMPSKVKASHAAGGEIIYEWIADSTYRVFFKFYRDCTGISEAAQESLCLSNTCNSTQVTVIMPKWTGPLPNNVVNGDPVSAGCSQYPNKCSQPSSSLPGYREWWYATLITLPFQCNYWRFSVGISARNGSVNMGGGNLYVETTFNNLLFQGNSSPYFSIKPIPYVCANQPFSYNNGAIDPNGDSLVTDVINPLDGGTCGPGSPIGLASSTPPLTIPNNPFQTNNTFVTNGATGQMNFTAAVTGAQTLTTRVREFRNGILIGYIMRDIQVQVLTCSTIQPNFSSPTSLSGGGVGTGGRIEGCVNQPLHFEWDMVSTDTGAILLAEDNHSFSIPAATIAYTNLATDSIHGNFNWTPTVFDGGKTFNFICTIKDSTCRPPGIMLYFPKSYFIYVWPPVRTVPDTSICPGETAFLNATGGANYVWSVMPGGSGISSLSCTNCIAPVATPLIPTTYVVTSSANSFCPNNTDTVTVGVLPALVFQAMKDTITCPQNSVMLDLKTNPPPGVTYKAKWTPATFLSSDTALSPITTPNSPITYRVVLTSSINKCKGFDTVTVDVLSGFKVSNKDTQVCTGQTVQVSATGDSRYNLAWTHTSQALAPYSSTTILNPVITPSLTASNPLPDTATYRLTASYPGCRDSSQEFKIEVQPYPSVTVDNDRTMCENDTFRLNGIVTPSYYPFDLTWTPGASLSNDKIPNPLFTAKQTTTLMLTATTSAKCSANDTVRMTVFSATFLIPKGDTAICPGSTTQLHLTGNGIKSFQWYPDIHISDKKGMDPFVWPTSTTTYTVIGVDTNKCRDTATVKVVVHPKATVNLPDSARIYPGEKYQMDPTGNCSYFQWFPPVGLDKSDISNPVAKPEVNTRYMVQAKTEAGCATSDSITLYVSPESIVDMANAFTPGSQPNATFKVVRRGEATLKNFSIYNRWGLKVFETSDVNKGWDGTYNGEPQPMGVYIYSVEGVTNTGRKFTKQGNVTLVR